MIWTRIRLLWSISDVSLSLFAYAFPVFLFVRSMITLIVLFSAIIILVLALTFSSKTCQASGDIWVCLANVVFFLNKQTLKAQHLTQDFKTSGKCALLCMMLYALTDCPFKWSLEDLMCTEDRKSTSTIFPGKVIAHLRSLYVGK